MNDAVQIALIVATPPTVVAMGSILIAIMQDKRSGKKLDHITVLTNSTLTAANKRIDELEQTLERLLQERGE